ncbi:MAG: undecaprenyldiphospho-muramoylpentapeptide beta-N-acetylglucosaminyltransferase [Halanaerobiales bacterium]|nr:undecaprenyldiphospho-muramoylpentapeptide beta-N-acetylglucosaminyltransferase [Halanaerobiales bacterium]
MKAVITGGGTGGHIYPALSIADKLNKRGWEIEYIGCGDSLEEDVLLKTDYSFRSLNVLPLPRKVNLKLFKSIFVSLKAVYSSYKLLKEINPDVVFGTGGYVTGPVLLSGYLSKIPTVIHEQNIYPGVTNKILSYFVNKIAVSNIEASKYFNDRVQDKIIETGNPIREKIVNIKRETGIKKLGLNKDYKTLFIMGGSQGAKTINNAFIESIEKIMDLNNLQVIMITGKRNYKNVINKIESYTNKYNDRLKVMSYLDNIEWAYAAADLIIYRAGATGLAEITGRGLPAILVPYPYSAEGHQKTNAKFMEKENAAVMVEDSKFNGDTLYKLLCEILFNDSRLKEMRQNSKNLAKLDADQNIVDIILDLVREE